MVYSLVEKSDRHFSLNSHFGLDADADQLEQAVSSAFTTSSELFAEQGEAIMKFLKATHGRLPPGVKAKLDACLAEIGKTWPVYRRFIVWAYRKLIF